MKMSEIEDRRIHLASLLDPTDDELQELRDCEITLGMIMASPKERSKAARRCEAKEAARQQWTSDLRQTRKTPAQMLQREIDEVLGTQQPLRKSRTFRR